ncbi:hypothetical protein [Candidatus Borreliella tachyglossi]|uniref:hypothetical protein n=1 Tax=Candidatus Borreliella tachyglossi TaxID=1964448 RepID=UPI0040429ED6
MKKGLIIISLFLCVNSSFAKVFYFSVGFSAQASLESFLLFNRGTGTVVDKWLSLGLFSTLSNFKNQVIPRFNALANSTVNVYGSYQENFNAINDLQNKLRSNAQINDVLAIDLSSLKDVSSILGNIDALRKFFLDLSNLSPEAFVQKLDGAGFGVQNFLSHLGETTEHAVELKEIIFKQLDEFGIGSSDDFLQLLDEISQPGSVLNDAFRNKLSPLFSVGFQGYFQVGLPIMSSDFYYGFELGFGMNLGRTIMPNLEFLRDSSSVSLGLGVMPRLFIKYDIYYIAATLFTGFGDKSLVVDPIYVGNLIGKGRVINPFHVIETGARLRLAFLNLESSVLFSVSDFQYRDLRFGLGFEIPIII